MLALDTVAAACAGLVALASSTTARAQARELRWDPPLDVTATAVATGLFAASVTLEPVLAPSRCRWCEVGSVDDQARTALVWQDTRAAGELSDVTAFALVPLTGLGLDALAASHDHAQRGVPVDALLMFEATMLALDAHEVTKLLVARERPSSHAFRLGNKVHSSDDDLSFFSGHATGSFAFASAAGTVATMRGYRWAPLPWVFCGGLATATGYLRIAADRHWLSDVLVGMATGVAIGIAVPLLSHAPRSE